MTTTSQTAARSAAPDRRSVTQRELWLKSTKLCVVFCGLEISCIDCDFDSSVFECSLLLIIYNNKSTPVPNECDHSNLCDFVHIKSTFLFDSMRMSLGFCFWLRRQREQHIDEP